ncbi:MAG: FAD-binding oxidoreductase [Verrucomicrobiota bacterium]
MSEIEMAGFFDRLERDRGIKICRESEPNHANVSGIKRSFRGRVHPESAESVRDIVREARRFDVALYPLSCGRNWGYGSSLPVTNNCTIIDLSKLDRIQNERKICREFPVAVVEPGVTQGQLFAAIDEEGLFFNATGAGPETSVLGNSLERGFGYSGLRSDDVLGMEVVLGTGEVMRTGFWGNETASTALRYPSGLGPSPKDLFFQSNFGIVTAIALRLRVKPPCQAAMMVALKGDVDEKAFFDALAELRREGVFTSVMHIGNRHRAKTTLGPIMFDVLEVPADLSEKRRAVDAILEKLPYRRWSGVTAVRGSAAVVDDVFTRVRECMETVANVERIDDASLSKVDVSEAEGRAAARAKSELLQLTRGVPIASPLWSPYWALGQDLPEDSSELDNSDVGLLFCAPVFPLVGKTIVEGVEIIESTLGEFGFVPYLTLNIANEMSILGITNIVFDRRDEAAVKKAHEAIDSLYRRLMDAGHYPYRLGIQSMDHAKECMGSSFETLTELKRVFDPDGIIAPGRYGFA